jgi:hypothetical protein
MIKNILILLLKLQLLLGQTQYAIITDTTTIQTTLTTITTTLSVIKTATTTIDFEFDSNCTYGTVYNGNNCDGKVSIGL